MSLDLDEGPCRVAGTTAAGHWCASARTSRSQPSRRADAEAEDPRAELEEYEQLRSGSVSTFEGLTLADLATLLVKARIARGWSQRQLAERLGVAEQQVQRYESSGYRSASLARILDFAATLGITITEQAELHDLDVA